MVSHRFGGERELCIPRSTQGIGRPSKRGNNRVAFALLLWTNPAMAGDHPAKDLDMAGNGRTHRLGRLCAPQPRGSFDIGEHERHRAHRQ